MSYGLVTLECEFLTAEEVFSFQLPDWLAKLTVAEVTNDPRYKNRNLARPDSLRKLDS